MINPYEFLGLTDKSTLDELRKAYYQMSLICHPDKGGNAEAMVTLQVAYNWIKEHLTNIQAQPDANKSYEEIQKEFDEYIAKQDSMKLPRYLDTVVETLNIQKEDYIKIYDEEIKNTCIPKSIIYDSVLVSLNELLRSKSTIEDITKEQVLERVRKDLISFRDNHHPENYFPASIPHGYGNLMDFNENYEKNVATPTHVFDKEEMVIYKEPASIFLNKPIGVENNPIEQKEDYSVYDGKIAMTDYKKAFTETDSASSIFDGLVSDESIDVLLAARKLEHNLKIIKNEKLDLAW